MYNALCWYLGINGEAERALPHCEKAVALAEETESSLKPEEFESLGGPTVTYVDSRGLVYGLLGRTEEAIADFERVLSWAEENSNELPPEIVPSRQMWLDALEKGENPFTPEVLEEQRHARPAQQRDDDREHADGAGAG